MSAEAIIRAEGLTKRFGDFVAVDDVTLHVERGSVFAFLGANGSGKSTTIRMLIGLLEPTAGTIEVDGIDVARHPRRVRDHIGYMGQKVSLYQGLTLRENVEFYAGLYGLAPRQLEERWGSLRERFALGEAEREKPEDLSAGVRQRAGLALSTLHRPRVLFLDEPTAGVDVENRALFWELIQDEADAGVTVFVTTHFLEEADYCDWISFIDTGRLVADASPAELRRQYSSGHRVRIEIARDAGGAGAARAVEEASERLARALASHGGAAAVGIGVSSEVAAEASSRLSAGMGSGASAAEVSRELSLEESAVVLRSDRLDPALLDAVRDVVASIPGARVHVEQPEMTDVFRALMRKTAESRRDAA